MRGSVITFDPDALDKRVAELEQELGTPGFWDDQQHAAQVSAEHARLSKRLDRYRRLTQDYQDAQELLAMDGDMAAEIETSIPASVPGSPRPRPASPAACP